MTAEPATINPLIYYGTQFALMFLLGWGAGHSLRIWTSITIAIIGIFVLFPIIAILLLAGDGAGWNIIASALTWLFEQLAAGMRSIPFLLAGTLLGTLYGLGFRP